MTTWTMDQVNNVKRLHAEVTIDTELIHRQGETVLTEVARQMAERLKDMAHPLGVELALDPSHYVIEWQYPDDSPWKAIGRMRWCPQTTTAEIRGGHLDGRLYDLARPGDPIRLLRPPTTSPASMMAETPATDLTVLADTYEVVGWREDGGVWVYAARP